MWLRKKQSGSWPSTRRTPYTIPLGVAQERKRGNSIETLPCEVQNEFPTAQAHAISRDAGIKLNTQKEKNKNFDKKMVPREAVKKWYQKEIHWC